MPDRKKIREYRETLHQMAKLRKDQRRKHLEGKAARLGTEIYGEERKAKPKTKTGAKPRR